MRETTPPPLTPAEACARLHAAGLPAASARVKAPLFERALASLTAGPEPVRLWWVPGRLEFLGKHTDYAGGPSLVCPVERGFVFAARRRADRRIRFIDVAGGREATFDFSSELTPEAGWANYPMTVARRLARNFAGPLVGADVAFASDLPQAAGMSSSSALVVGTYLVLAAANDLPSRPAFRDAIASPEALAEYLGTLENGRSFGPLAGDRGVGTFGGSEDHTAILLGKPGTLSLYDFAPVRLRRHVARPAGWCVAIASSGVLAEKTGEARALYNNAAELAGRLSGLWREQTGEALSLADVLAEGPSAVAALRRYIGNAGADAPALHARLDHFLLESAAVESAAAALLAGDVPRLAEAVNASQAGAERLLRNQVPETVYLAEAARRLGAPAATSFGAGFGGSVWALVREEAAGPFLAAWHEAYAAAFPEPATRCQTFTTVCGPGVVELGIRD